MPDIVLSTLNARYIHAAFGLRYLMANLGPLAGRAEIVEFDINQRPIDMLDRLLTLGPRIVGFGVYIWNVEQTTRLVADLKRVAPETLVVIGGPEVSHDSDDLPIVGLADYLIRGEADLAFGDLCGALLAGRRPLRRVIDADVPDFAPRPSGGRAVQLPYRLYSDDDLATRVIYIEASRGCPFRCEFCLSSLDVPVRNVPLETLLLALDDLLRRGARQFKFVDRTFNLNLNFSRPILQFFLDRLRPGLFLHFEMIPDRLPEPLRELIRQFPAGALQFEVGIQTLNPAVERLISRRQDHDRLADNLRFLRDQTGVHVHADLIVGLPGEDLASFGRGFDQLLALGPAEIQIGILKRLRGTPIRRHDAQWEMVYSPSPPYEVLRTKTMDFGTLQRLRRLARYWDLVANSGNFTLTRGLLLSPSIGPMEAGLSRVGHGGPVAHDEPGPSHTRADAVDAGGAADFARVAESADAGDAGTGCDDQAITPPDSTVAPRPTRPSAFEKFLGLSDWLFATTGQTHAIALTGLAELLFKFMTTQQQRPPEQVAGVIFADFQRLGRSDRPAFLRDLVPPADTRSQSHTRGRAKRQARHAAGSV